MYNLLNQMLKKKYQLWFDKHILLTEGGETTHPKPRFSNQLWNIPFRRKSSRCWVLSASVLHLLVSCRHRHWSWHLDSVTVFFLIRVIKTWSEWERAGEEKEQWPERKIWGGNRGADKEVKVHGKWPNFIASAHKIIQNKTAGRGDHLEIETETLTEHCGIWELVLSPGSTMFLLYAFN